MTTYLHSPSLWLHDTLDIIRGHHSLTLQEIETIVIETMVKCLDKSIALPMLSEIIAAIQQSRQQVISPDLAVILSELETLTSKTKSLDEDEHTDKMYLLLENALDLLNSGK